MEKIVRKFNINNKEDLSQYIYLQLLEKPESLIQELQDTNTYLYYIARIVTNQIKSYDSKLYYESRISRCSSGIDTYLNTLSGNAEDNAMHKLDSVLDEEDSLIIGMIIYNEELGKRKHIPTKEICERYGCSRSKAVKIFEDFRKKAKKII